MKIISNKTINYPFAVLVWVLVSLIFIWLCYLVDFSGKFWKIISIIAGAVVAFGDTTRVPILSAGLLLFNGEEVKSGKNSVWLSPGMYFTFYLFKVSQKEAQVMEKRDVIIHSFDCQSKDGKVITAEANGDWFISNNPEAEDIFKLQDESKMEGNLQMLIKRTTLRVCGGLDYYKEILGENIGENVLKDDIFKRECKRYGIEFHNLLIQVLAKDLNQENINTYSDELRKKFKKEFPKNHKFTSEELEKIDEKIQVQLKLAKKIITDSPLLGRYDIAD